MKRHGLLTAASLSLSLSLSLALLGATLATAKPPASAPEAAVRADFQALKKAMLGGDGPATAALASPNSIAVYEKCRNLALASPKTALEALSQVEILIVLQVRKDLSAKRLAAMNGADLLAWGVTAGLISKDSVTACEIDTLEFSGKVAVASMLVRGEVVPDLAFRFVREGTRWTMDFEGLMKLAEPALAQNRDKAGQSKVDFAMSLLEQQAGKPLPRGLLDGPLTAK